MDEGVVTNLLDPLHRSILREDLLNCRLRCGEHEITYIQNLHLGREGGREGGRGGERGRRGEVGGGREGGREGKEGEEERRIIRREEGREGGEEISHQMNNIKLVE